MKNVEKLTKKEKSFLTMILVLTLAMLHLNMQHMRFTILFGKPVVVVFAILWGLMLSAIFFAIISHAMGHLVFGFLTGYRFVSLRIFHWMIIKNGDHFRLRWIKRCRTVGQCMMSPPSYHEGKFSMRLFLYGGSIMDFINSIVFYCKFRMQPSNLEYFFISMFCLLNCICNGVPSRIKGFNNDGNQYKCCKKTRNDRVTRALWSQWKVYEARAYGIRLDEMPSEWFFMPKHEEMNQPIVCDMSILYCKRMLYQNKIEAALMVMEEIMNRNNRILCQDKRLLLCEQIYLMILRGESKMKIDALLDKNQVKFMREMSDIPVVSRTWYAYALILENKEKKARKYRRRFLKACELYPYETSMEFEMLEWLEREYSSEIAS